MANAMGIEPIMTTAAEATISGSRDATQAINGRQNDSSADAVLCCSPEDMGDLVEYCLRPSPLMRKLVKNLPPLQNGRVPVPDGPGLGIELDDEILREFRVG